MKLLNTLTRKIEPVKPLNDKTIGLYTCGPTVYDYQHVGNYAAYIRWDTLVRLLNARAYRVNWIMNITDVGHLTSDADEGEDKLEKGARREGKTAWEVAQFYTEDFKQGLRDLNISISLNNLPKATDHISEQIKMVEMLEKKGFTYQIDDGIYFDTSKLPDYGKLARLKADQLQPGARVAVNLQKRNPTDFALWKFSPKGQKLDMEWESPWGTGFPGWHLECSAISMHYLGDTFDIHGGGIDHIPVHHTNEIAQSEAVTGKPLANYWIHSNFVTVNGTKISKSLSNGITLHDILKRGHSLMAYRLLVLQSHYRAEADFSWESLSAAENRLKGLQAMADLRFQALNTSKITKTDLEKAKTEILNNLENDIKTPEALASLSNLEKSLEGQGVNKDLKKDFNDFIQWLDSVFGLRLSMSKEITSEQKELVEKRAMARAGQNWEKADEIRSALTKQGIGLRDTEEGQLWHRL